MSNDLRRLRPLVPVGGVAALGAAFIRLAAALGFLDALYCAAMAFIFLLMQSSVPRGVMVVAN